MKRYMMALMLGTVLLSCGNGATDQDPKTDTTQMPPERPIQDSQTNTSYGVQDRDSAGRDSLRK